MAHIDHSGNSTAPAALAVFVPPQRRAPPRRPTRSSLVIDVHPAFPAPTARPSAARSLVRPPRAKRNVGRYLVAGAVLLTAVTAIIAFRAPLVGAMPQLNGLFTAIGMPVNVLGVELSNVAATRVWEGGWEQIRVTGVVVNVSGRPIAVPTIELVVLDANGAVIGQWQQAVAEGELAAGSTLPFTTDFPEPPAEAAGIEVHFGGPAGEAAAAPAPVDIAVRYGNGTMQTITAPAPEAPTGNTTVRFGNATVQTIGVP